MNNVNITLQLCEDDRKRIDELIAFAGQIVREMKSTRGARDFLEKQLQLPADVPPPFDPPAPAPVPEAKPVSLGEFQKAIVTRCAESAATKQKVQALVHKYADSVSNIPEDKRSEVLAALTQI